MTLIKYYKKQIDVNKWFIISFLTLLTSLLFLHGLILGMGGVALNGRFMLLGFMECGTYSLDSLFDFKCNLVGGDYGGLMPTGSPIYLLGALILFFTPLSAAAALMVVGFLLLGIGLYGGYKLMCMFGVSRYISLTMSYLYFITSGVIHMQSFGGTYWGVVVMPAALFMGIYLLRRIAQEKRLKIVIGIYALWATISTLQLFIDGYTFFMTFSAILGVALFMAWSQRKNKIISSAILGVPIFASTFAYVVYTYTVPISDTLGNSPVELFRALGLDLITLLQPSVGIWWRKLSDIWIQPSELWGDGTNAAYNYIGFLLLMAAILGFVTYLRSNNTFQKKVQIVALSVVLLGAFTLSLGPSLKFNSQRPTIEGRITYQNYLMPSSEAVVDLPTSKFFTKIPGISSMRATYRWHLLTHFLIIFFAAIGVEYVYRNKTSKYAVPLLLLIIIELSPNPLALIRKHESTGSQINKFNTQVINELDDHVAKNERVLFYPNAAGGNDYLANYIAPMIGISTYNVGNDKAVNEAKLHRPEHIATLLEFNDDERMNDDELIIQILRDKTATAVIVPYFDLRWDSYSWPPRNNTAEDRALDVLSRLSDDHEVVIINEDFFSVVKLKAD